MSPAELAIERRGTGERVVLVHGFTQTGRCWGPIADDLARDHELVLIDAPGHGRSTAITASFEAGAGLIGDASGRGTYVGYSMGGRYGLRLALDHPELVDRLVLVGATPGIEDEAERFQRRLADGRHGERLEDIGVDAFIDEWLAQPLFAGLAADVQFVAERLENDVPGLASSLRTAGTGAQEPLWDRLGELEMPVLLVTGANDVKFTAIAERMAAFINDAGRATATFTTIPDAGHTAHLEQPEAFLTALRAWLTTHPTPPAQT